MIHDTRDKGLGYDQVITEPDSVIVFNGSTLVRVGKMWYDCHPKPTYDCLMRRMFPMGGYGVRFALGETYDLR